jgi:hypothetical protein
MAFLDLERVNEYLLVITEDVDHYLGGFQDSGGDLGGMVLAKESKIGDSANIQDIWAGEQKEVTKHLIAVPVDSEVGKKIENVKSVTVPVYGGMDIRDKGLKPFCRLQFAHLHARAGLKQRRMVGEPEVDDLSSVADGSFAGGTHEEKIILHRVYVPDDVIARDKAGEEVIQAVQSCTKVGVDPGH